MNSDKFISYLFTKLVLNTKQAKLFSFVKFTTYKMCVSVAKKKN